MTLEEQYMIQQEAIPSIRQIADEHRKVRVNKIRDVLKQSNYFHLMKILIENNTPMPFEVNMDMGVVMEMRKVVPDYTQEEFNEASDNMYPLEVYREENMRVLKYNDIGAYGDGSFSFRVWPRTAYRRYLSASFALGSLLVFFIAMGVLMDIHHYWFAIFCLVAGIATLIAFLYSLYKMIVTSNSLVTDEEALAHIPLVRLLETHYQILSQYAQDTDI